MTLDIALKFMTPFIAPLITLTMGLIGLFITIRHFKVVRTVSYIERMNHPNMADIRACVDEWLASGISDDERLAQLKKNFALHARVRLFYNTIAELAIAYHYGTINRKMTLEIWEPLISEYWEKLRFYVLHRRSQGAAIGFHFEALAKTFEKHRNRKSKQSA